MNGCGGKRFSRSPSLRESPSLQLGLRVEGCVCVRHFLLRSHQSQVSHTNFSRCSQVYHHPFCPVGDKVVWGGCDTLIIEHKGWRLSTRSDDTSRSLWYCGVVMSGEDAPRPCPEDLIVLEIKTNKRSYKKLLTIFVAISYSRKHVVISDAQQTKKRTYRQHRRFMQTQVFCARGCILGRVTAADRRIKEKSSFVNEVDHDHPQLHGALCQCPLTRSRQTAP
jgi:hypothetical protein